MTQTFVTYSSWILFLGKQSELRLNQSMLFYYNKIEIQRFLVETVNMFSHNSNYICEIAIQILFIFNGIQNPTSCVAKKVDREYYYFVSPCYNRSAIYSRWQNVIKKSIRIIRSLKSYRFLFASKLQKLNLFHVLSRWISLRNFLRWSSWRNTFIRYLILCITKPWLLLYIFLS